MNVKNWNGFTDQETATIRYIARKRLDQRMNRRKTNSKQLRGEYHGNAD